ncbi:hypothetical protein [Chthoniobacter flavus]|nr:hypothetical protein [Chthoniobacter flavus]
MAVVWALFFTFAPGFGVQYLVWVSPFLIYYSARWFLAFTAAGSVALFVFYNSISNGMPWQKGIGLERFFPVWGPPLLLPWVVFVAFVILNRREFGIGAAPQNGQLDDASGETGESAPSTAPSVS